MHWTALGRDIAPGNKSQIQRSSKVEGRPGTCKSIHVTAEEDPMEGSFQRMNIRLVGLRWAEAPNQVHIQPKEEGKYRPESVSCFGVRPSKSIVAKIDRTVLD